MTEQTTVQSVAAVPQNGHAKGVSSEKHSDPMVGVLAAFAFVPPEYHDDLFNDFREAAESHDLRRLLDTISDWAATAELYANPTLAAEIQEAIGGRKGVADWLTG